MEILRNITTNAAPFDMEGEVWFPLFDRYTKFVVEESGTLEYARVCARALASLSAGNIDHLCRATLRCCNDFLDAIGAERKVFDNPRDILELLSPVNLIVPVEEKRGVAVVHLEMRGDWEDEHALEWIVRDGVVLYVGLFHFEDPWADYSVKERWNYA